MFPDSRLLCRHASYWSFGPLIILWQTGQSWLEIWSWYIWLQTIFIFPLVRWIDVVTILALTISILASGVSPGSNLDCWNRWILLPTVERNNAVCVKKGLDGFWRASNQSFVLCSCIFHWRIIKIDVLCVLNRQTLVIWQFQPTMLTIGWMLCNSWWDFAT